MHSNAPTLSDFFQIKRGLATGDNNYFILPEEEIVSRGLPMDVFTPILPSPRYLLHDEVLARKDGSPNIKRRLFLLDTKLSEEEIHASFPALFLYLEEGKAADFTSATFAVIGRPGTVKKIAHLLPSSVLISDVAIPRLVALFNSS